MSTDRIEEWLGGGPRLRRVYEVNQQMARADGGVTTAVSLEVWEDKVRLVYARSVVDPSMPDSSNEFDSWTVDDGHGTDFRTAGASGSGDGLYFYANSSWQPRPHDEAKVLMIRSPVVGIDVEIALD